MIVRASISQEISNYNSRITAYVASMSYTYCQLCVIADPNSMLPVSVELDGEKKHLEDVAGIVVHKKEIQGDKVTIDVFVKEVSYLTAVLTAIYKSHPEFKATLETFENDETRAFDEAVEKDRKEHPENYDEDFDEEREMNRKYIKCVMPPVDKDRRDLLMQLVDLYYNRCIGSIDALKVKTLATLAPIFIGVPAEEIDQAKNTIDDDTTRIKDIADQLTETKREEIEDAYNEYIAEHPEGAVSHKEEQETETASDESSEQDTTTADQSSEQEESAASDSNNAENQSFNMPYDDQSLIL